MSQTYWNVEGYGVPIDTEIFDVEKILAMPELATLDKDEAREALILGVNIFELTESDYFGFYDFIEIIADGTSLSLGDTADAGYGEFLMMFSNNPWNFSDEETLLSKEDVNRQIINTLKPYLKDSIDMDNLALNIGDISYHGVG